MGPQKGAVKSKKAGAFLVIPGPQNTQVEKKSHTSTLEQTVREEKLRKDWWLLCSFLMTWSCVSQIHKALSEELRHLWQGFCKAMVEVLNLFPELQTASVLTVAAAPRTVFLGCALLLHPECTGPSKPHPQLLPLGIGKVLSKHYRSFKQQNSLAVTSINFKGSIKALLEIILKLSTEIAFQRNSCPEPDTEAVWQPMQENWVRKRHWGTSPSPFFAPHNDAGLR